jgi:hypothetical protein
LRRRVIAQKAGRLQDSLQKHTGDHHREHQEEENTEGAAPLITPA